MNEFKKWISYLYVYNGELKGKNVGFVRSEIRDGWCWLDIRIKGAYECDATGLEVGMFVRQQECLRRVPVGTMMIREGSGKYEAVTEAANLFGKGISWEDWVGIWLICPGKETIYLASWEKTGCNTGEFFEKEMPKEPSLWESMTRDYPKIWPQWQRQGVEMLQIRPTDIRYLPRRLWYYSNNSFLLHGYYQYKHLMLGRMTEEENCYLLGVPGRRNPRESYSAEMFGFHHFLPVQEQEGYWYTKIRL